jgi:hypothetical protein
VTTLLAALAACGGTAMPTVSITGKDFAFAMPNSLPAGLVDVTFKNAGKEPHQINLARLNSGVTPVKFVSILQQQGPDAALALLTFAGGANTIDAGMSQEVVVNLPAGQYVALCFVTSPNGKSHIEEGMIKFFTVNSATTGSQPSAPDAVGTVLLKDFTIRVPANLSAGTYTWKVTNNGPQTHEMALVKLNSGKTLHDVRNYANNPIGPPPFTEVGGMGALAPVASGWVMLTLQKGTYVALCFAPDVHSGKPHFDEGMVTQFSVK